MKREREKGAIRDAITIRDTQREREREREREYKLQIGLDK